MPETDTAKEAVRKTAKTMKAEAPTVEAATEAATTQFPELFREMAEKGVEQAKENYARIRNAAEEATDIAEDTYLTATRGATELNLKAIEALRTNVNANFDYARELLAAKSFSEAMELSAGYMRRQFETFADQAKEFTAVAQKVAADASAPLKASASRSMNLH